MFRKNVIVERWRLVCFLPSSSLSATPSGENALNAHVAIKVKPENVQCAFVVCIDSIFGMRQKTKNATALRCGAHRLRTWDCLEGFPGLFRRVVAQLSLTAE